SVSGAPSMAASAARAAPVWAWRSWPVSSRHTRVTSRPGTHPVAERVSWSGCPPPNSSPPHRSVRMMTEGKGGSPMAITDTQLVEHTTTAALEERAKLKKHFGRFDMFFFLICTLVGLDTLGAGSSDGAQEFTSLRVLGLCFFVPYALLTAELGAAFHEEGGAYIWTKLAFGRFAAA